MKGLPPERCAGRSLARCPEKLQAKQAAKNGRGRKAVTDADRRRWNLPKKEWKAWEVPFDTDPDWPKDLQIPDGLSPAWRAKMDEVNAASPLTPSRRNWSISLR
jgi:hypothetical protein